MTQLNSPSISFSIYFPTKAFPETVKCRQINRFQSFILSFPSFGRGFDSHRPLHDSAKFLLIRLPFLTSHTHVAPKNTAQRMGRNHMTKVETGCPYFKKKTERYA